jgi:cephalosporin hydroxylase
MSIAEWELTFSAVLGPSRRWDAFRLIANDLIARRRPLYIVETGCARLADNWLGDGQSTLVWDWLLTKQGGEGWAFDIDETATRYAASRVSQMKIAQVDSIIGLRTTVEVGKIDFLYLDSFDLVEGIESPTHHLAELTSVYPQLPSGCLIAVDDCVDEEYGKHRFVRDWLSRLGIEPVLRSYVTVWRKP